MDAGERPGGAGEPAYYRPPITVRGKPRSRELLFLILLLMRVHRQPLVSHRLPDPDL